MKITLSAIAILMTFNTYAGVSNRRKISLKVKCVQNFNNISSQTIKSCRSIKNSYSYLCVRELNPNVTENNNYVLASEILACSLVKDKWSLACVKEVEDLDFELIMACRS